MFKVVVEIRLKLTGPILTQSSEPGAWGLDYVAARNANGDYYLPGTLLAGKLRQAWEELSDVIRESQKGVSDVVGMSENWFNPGDLEKWLGTPTENAPPNTKQLFFSDLVYQANALEVAPFCSSEPANADVSDTNNSKPYKPEVLTKAINRIQIDSKRGAVAKNQLVTIESPFLAGRDYDFTGELHFFAADTEIDRIMRHINAGLQWTEQLGALRTVGFGRVKQVQLPSGVKGQPLLKPSPEQYPNQPVALSIRPLYPFCIGGKPVADNLFESLDFIPGNVILGAIATTWNHLCGQSGGLIDVNLKDPERTKLKEHFSKIRITHAFPSEKDSVLRQVSAPLSIVNIGKDKEDRLYDVILLAEPCLIDNEAPAFAIDWKDNPHKILAEKLGKPYVKKELRTRSAIDPSNLRSADEKLFSYEQIVPAKLVWNAWLDLSRVLEADRNQVFAELKSLLKHGIAALGKTKTPATIEWPKTCGPSHTSEIKAIEGKQWIVTLQTDTLLGAPVVLDEISGQTELEHMYKQAWSDLSCEKLQLVRYFASQRLAGGTFRHHVFQKGGNGGEYRPWLLTEAGSVFLLKLAERFTEKQGEELIENWLTQGLPLAKTTLDYYRINEDENQQWQDCPYVPQNGYGEIAVNLDLGFSRLESNSEQITRRIPVLKKTEEIAS